MKLVAIRKITGTIKLKSDLHIGMGYAEMHIGEIYSFVLKHPHTLQPYISGSLIKGTIRSLLELSLGLIKYTDGAFVKAETLSKITNEEDRKNAEIILKLFGCGVGNDNEEILEQIGSSRASFSDSVISKKWFEEHNNYSLTKINFENEILPEGIEFDFVIVIKEFENDDFNSFIKIIKKGLKLLELDSLGCSKSMGYGRIEFLNLSLDSQVISLPDVNL